MDKEQTIKEIGARIHSLRKKSGLTIVDLAEKAGVSEGGLSDIENGNKDVRASTLIAICQGLGITVSKLLKGL